MIIQIKMGIKRNHAIIKYFKFYITVIILVNNIYIKKKRFWICHHFPPPAYSIMYLELVGSAHVRNNGSDHLSAIIEHALGDTQLHLVSVVPN